MRNWVMLFALATSVMQAQAAAQQAEANMAAQLPGRLDSFLTANPSATRTTKFLGALTGVGDVWDVEIDSVRQAQITATFTALLAWLPGSPTVREKGVELQLEYLGNHGEHRPHGRIYIDEGILGQFDDELEEVLQIERYLQCRHPIEYRT